MQIDFNLFKCKIGKETFAFIDNPDPVWSGLEWLKRNRDLYDEALQANTEPESTGVYMVRAEHTDISHELCVTPHDGDFRFELRGKSSTVTGLSLLIDEISVITVGDKYQTNDSQNILVPMKNKSTKSMVINI